MCGQVCFRRIWVDEKGYRCYDLKTNRVITTMNCDFLESEYFFNHLSSQGESESDTIDSLSWSMPSQPLGPPPMPPQLEEVVRTTEQISNVQQTVTQCGTIQNPPQLIPTVSLPESEAVANNIPD